MYTLLAFQGSNLGYTGSLEVIMGIRFFAPFLIPIGVALLGAILDSVTREGQKLESNGFSLSIRSIRHKTGRIAFHFGKYMHHIYLGCFAYDLAAIIPMAGANNSTSLPISYGGRDIAVTAFWIVAGIIIHLIAYVHTLLIARDFEQGRAERPITFLHYFLYLPLSIVMLVMIRM